MRFRIAIGFLLVAVLLAADADVERRLEAAIHREMVVGDLKGAIDQYKKLAQGKDRTVAAKALVRMGECYDKMGDVEARKAYERVVKEFGDQTEAVTEARKHLAKDGPAEKGLTVREIGAKLGDKHYGHSISRDGRYIADTEHGLVNLRDVLTGEERRLTGEFNSPREDLNGALISPDGRLVAYAKTPAQGGNSELYVVGADGSNPRRLAGGNDDSAFPWDWSADGKQILASVRRKDEKKYRVMLVSVSDGSSKMTDLPPGPRFSPDGRYVAFVASSDIFVQPVDGGVAVPLVENGGHTGIPVWTLDGKRILFTSDRNGNYDLWSIQVSGGKPAGSPELIREGVSNLLGVSRDGDCYYQTGSMAKDLYLANVDPQTGKLTSRPKQVTGRGINTGAAWSPNGEYLAYYSSRGPVRKLTVVIRTTKTGKERELSPKEPLDLCFFQPQWFPDSRSLFVHSWDGKLRQVDIETGESSVLLGSAAIPRYSDGQRNPAYTETVILAPDGHRFYYQLRDREMNQTRIVQRDLQGGPEKELCRVSADIVGGLSVSPDGSRLAFAKRWQTETGDRKPNWAIMTMPASGGEPKQLIGNSPPWGGGPVWSRDGRHLFFLLSGDIYSIPAEGGSPEPLGLGVNRPYLPSVHPDGKQLVFTREQWNNELWVMKNPFRDARAAR